MAVKEAGNLHFPEGGVFIRLKITQLYQGCPQGTVGKQDKHVLVMRMEG